MILDARSIISMRLSGFQPSREGILSTYVRRAGWQFVCRWGTLLRHRRRVLNLALTQARVRLMCPRVHRRHIRLRRRISRPTIAFSRLRGPFVRLTRGVILNPCGRCRLTNLYTRTSEPCAISKWASARRRLRRRWTLSAILPLLQAFGPSDHRDIRIPLTHI